MWMTFATLACIAAALLWYARAEAPRAELAALDASAPVSPGTAASGVERVSFDAEAVLASLERIERRLQQIETRLATWQPSTREDAGVPESTPAMPDQLSELSESLAELRLELELAERRVAVLAKAVRRITQRVNLFDRVLIPTARENIKRIQIFLGDIERDAVVRSKIAKAKQVAYAQASRAARADVPGGAERGPSV